jgi:hypothetical protein
LAESLALVSIHQPLIVQGTAIKTNNNQRYATNAETGFLLRELARRAGVPVQVGSSPVPRAAVPVKLGQLIGRREVGSWREFR